MYSLCVYLCMFVCVCVFVCLLARLRKTCLVDLDDIVLYICNSPKIQSNKLDHFGSDIVPH